MRWRRRREEAAQDLVDQTFDPGDRAQAAVLEAEMQRLRDQIGGLPADPLGVDPRRAALEEELQQAP